MSNYLVLGANGLIGSSVSERLAIEGHNIRAFDLFQGHDNLVGIESIEKMKADYLKEEDLKKAVKEIETVFHCIHTTIPRTSVEKPLFDAETNIVPSLRLLEQATKAGVKKIVYISSLAVYGNPLNNPIKETDAMQPISPYGVSKLAIEKYLELFYKNHGLDYTILRLAPTYGERQRVSPGSGVIANFVFNSLHEKPIIMYGNGNAERNFLFVEDSAKGISKAAFKKTKSKIFNLGGSETVSVKQLAGKVANATGKKLKINHIEKKNEIEKLVCDFTRAKQELLWKPEVKLDEGIKRCVATFKKGE